MSATAKIARQKIYLALLGIRMPDGYSIPAEVRLEIEQFAEGRIAQLEKEQSESEKLALENLAFPLRCGSEEMFVYDADNRLILEVKGWTKFQELENGEDVQNAIGRLVADSLNSSFHVKKCPLEATLEKIKEAEGQRQEQFKEIQKSVGLIARKHNKVQKEILNFKPNPRKSKRKGRRGDIRK